MSYRGEASASFLNKGSASPMGQTGPLLPAARLLGNLATQALLQGFQQPGSKPFFPQCDLAVPPAWAAGTQRTYLCNSLTYSFSM